MIQLSATKVKRTLLGNWPDELFTVDCDPMQPSLKVVWDSAPKGMVNTFEDNFHHRPDPRCYNMKAQPSDTKVMHNLIDFLAPNIAKKRKMSIDAQEIEDKELAKAAIQAEVDAENAALEVQDEVSMEPDEAAMIAQPIVKTRVATRKGPKVGGKKNGK